MSRNGVVALAVLLVLSSVRADSPADRERLLADAEQLLTKSQAEFDDGRFANCLPLLEKAMAIYQTVYPTSKYPDGHARLAECLSKMGVTYKTLGRLDRAGDFLGRALAMRRKLYPEPLYPDGHADLLLTLINMATFLEETSAYPEAFGYYERALAMGRRLFPDG